MRLSTIAVTVIAFLIISAIAFHKYSGQKGLDSSKPHTSVLRNSGIPGLSTGTKVADKEPWGNIRVKIRYNVIEDPADYSYR